MSFVSNRKLKSTFQYSVTIFERLYETFSQGYFPRDPAETSGIEGIKKRREFTDVERNRFNVENERARIEIDPCSNNLT